MTPGHQKTPMKKLERPGAKASTSVDQWPNGHKPSPLLSIDHGTKLHSYPLTAFDQLFVGKNKKDLF
jgi:hypothetical protein